MLKVSTFCSGIGSPEQAIKNLGIEHKNIFACEINKYARKTYTANHECETMYHDMTKEDYVGEHWYSDINISGIPCQAFSLAGKRLGELDPRGLLFYDFYRYVKNQQPKYFIIENVKGLLSDNDGNTFQNWINLLGQSVNGDQFMFPHEDSLMYNLHWQVLNTKDYGLPQNRERVFLIGIRNDLPNSFVFPKGVPLKLRLKDILEDEVDEKYYLSEKTISYITKREGIYTDFNPEISRTICSQYAQSSNGSFIKSECKFGFYTCCNLDIMCSDCEDGSNYEMLEESEFIKVPSATKSGYEIATEGDSINLEHPNSETRRGRVGKQVAQTLTTSCNQGVMVVGFERTEEAKIKRSKSIKEKGIDTGNFSDRQLKLKDQDYSDTILANPNHQKEGLIAEVKIGAMRGRNPENPSDRTTGAPTRQMLEINENGTSNCLTSVQKDNLVIQINPSLESGGKQPYQQNRIYDSEGIAPALCRGKSDLNVTYNNPKVKHNLSGGKWDKMHEQSRRVYDENGIAPTIHTMGGGNQEIKTFDQYRIRKLTVLECFRLQGFPDSFHDKAVEAGVSNSQLYKQAGNSISVPVIQAILKNLLT